ncbi:hypothetical protein PFISCL1PPCAC_18925, partial [Pristionchus fissidentatus]
ALRGGKGRCVRRFGSGWIDIRVNTRYEMTLSSILVIIGEENGTCEFSIEKCLGYLCLLNDESTEEIWTNTS